MAGTYHGQSSANKRNFTRKVFFHAAPMLRSEMKLFSNGSVCYEQPRSMNDILKIEKLRVEYRSKEVGSGTKVPL